MDPKTSLKIMWAAIAAFGIKFFLQDQSIENGMMIAIILGIMVFLTYNSEKKQLTGFNAVVFSTVPVAFYYLLPFGGNFEGKLNDLLDFLYMSVIVNAFNNTTSFAIFLLLPLAVVILITVYYRQKNQADPIITVIAYIASWIASCSFIGFDPFRITGIAIWFNLIWSVCLFADMGKIRKNTSGNSFNAEAPKGFITYLIFCLLSIIMVIMTDNENLTIMIPHEMIGWSSFALWFSALLILYIILLVRISPKYWKNDCTEAEKINYIAIPCAWLCWTALIPDEAKDAALYAAVLLFPFAAYFFGYLYKNVKVLQIHNGLPAACYWGIIILMSWIFGNAISVSTFYIMLALATGLLLYIAKRITRNNRTGLFAFVLGMLALLWMFTTLDGFNYSLVTWDRRTPFLIMTIMWLFICSAGAHLCKSVSGAKSEEYTIVANCFYIVPLIVFAIALIRMALALAF